MGEGIRGIRGSQGVEKAVGAVVVVERAMVVGTGVGRGARGSEGSG